MKDCLRNRGVDVREAKDRSVWRGFVKENAWRDATVVGSHSYMKPVGENLSVAEGIKGKIYLFSFLS